MTGNIQVEIPRQEIANFCKKHHIRRLSLFGSVLGEEFGPDSDIDVLVEFEEGHVPGFFRIYDMELELSRLFPRRKIELRTPSDLSRYFRREIMESCEVQYAKV